MYRAFEVSTSEHVLIAHLLRSAMTTSDDVHPTQAHHAAVYLVDKSTYTSHPAESQPDTAETYKFVGFFIINLTLLCILTCSVMISYEIHRNAGLCAKEGK